jgi:hypothetical protein
MKHESFPIQFLGIVQSAEAALDVSETPKRSGLQKIIVGSASHQLQCPFSFRKAAAHAKESRKLVICLTVFRRRVEDSAQRRFCCIQTACGGGDFSKVEVELARLLSGYGDSGDLIIA